MWGNFPGYYRPPAGQDDVALGGDDGSYEPLWKWGSLGVLFPLVLLCLAAFQLWHFEVTIPDHGGGWQTMDSAWVVLGAVAVELGGAAVLVGRFPLQNLICDRDAWVWPMQGGGLLMAVGVVSILVEMVRLMAGL